MTTWPPSHGPTQMAFPSVRCAPVCPRTAPMTNSASPTIIATVSFHVVSNPPQYMIRFAQQNAAGSTSRGIGTRYERGRRLSTLCSAASETGAKAYMIAVAPVTTLTSAFQLLNGPKASVPTTAANRIDTTGTPSLFVVASAVGISRSSPSAYDSRADVATYTTPVPAGEITASTSSIFASQPAPSASASVYHAP